MVKSCQVDHGICGWFWDDVIYHDGQHDGGRQAAVLSFCSHDTSCTQTFESVQNRGGGVLFQLYFQIHRHCEKKWLLMKHLDGMHRKRYHAVKKIMFYLYASATTYAEERLSNSFNQSTNMSSFEGWGGGGCLHTTDISCTWALIMNGRVFGRTFNNKVGSQLSLPWNDTPVASRVKQQCYKGTRFPPHVTKSPGCAHKHSCIMCF